ncbi:hypothetical protein E4U41_004870 [Claviceps citrina]|nr:hypothetical protein E4U41_004870 [Claviceps citrina]
MPPRAAGRRQARFSSREPDSPSPHQNNLSTFQKPNLPPLQGTPSSRRQYSYGADVEPMPSRPGQGLQRTQVRDISNAVRSVLTRHEGDEDEQETSQFPKVQKQREQRQFAAAERDELAGAPQQGRHQPSYLSGTSGFDGITRSQFSERNQATDDSEADDVRSFGMESDFYGDATIESTPKASTTQPAQPSPLREVRSLNTRSADDAVRRSTLGKQLDPSREDRVLRPGQQTTQRSQIGPARHTIGPSPLRVAPRRPSQVASPSKLHPIPSLQARNEVEQDQEATEEEEGVEQPDGGDLDATEEEREPKQDREGEDESDLGESVGPHTLQHFTNTNTPAIRRRQLPSVHEPQRTRPGGPSSALPPRQPVPRSQLSSREALDQTGRVRPIRQESEESEEAAETSQDSSQSGRWLTRATATSNLSSLFAHAKLLASSSPFAIPRRYPADQDEREAAIQRDIDEAEAELAWERRLRATAESRRRWQQRWHWIKSFVPFAGHAPEDSEEHVSSLPREDEMRRASLGLLHYANPLTYLRGMASLIELLLDWITTLIHHVIPTGLWDRLSSVFGFLPHIIVGLLAFALAFAIATQIAGSAEGEGDWIPRVVDMTRRALDGARDKVYDYVPMVSWPKRERWADLNDLWDDGDDTASDRIEQFLNRMEDEFLALKRAGKMHDASLEKLEKVVPRIVHMELRDGKPVVSQEFWHALRDLLRGDGSFLTFDKTGPEYEVSSEGQWKAVASRLVTDPLFSSTLDHAMESLDDRMSGKITSFWNTWVRDNDEKIAQMLGSAVDQIKSAGSQKEFEDRLAKVVKEELAQKQKGGQVVSRDEFLRHLRNEFASHRSEIRAELNELRPRLEQLIMQQSAELAARQTGAHGLSRAETTALVSEVVRKALADVNLEALARGTIHRHWDSDLRHQVNYFSVGSGAIIDAKHTSSTWDPAGQGVISQGEYKNGLRGSRGFPPIAALDGWQDQGDCWCAARSVNHRGNPHGASLAVQLAHRIIPQHIVIEHVLPGATTEPNARPRDIEVYAEVLDPDVRERVLDFGAAYFPDDESDWNYTPPDYPARFVKITRFAYRGAEADNGVYVHRLSSELMGLGATTDHVIVRAVSNYGAENHTCFYRVRLYGFNPELDA